MLHEQTYNPPVDGVWGTFDRERGRLNRQEIDPDYADGSGLSPEELRDGFHTLWGRLSDAPPVIKKARLFAYLALNARILVDPEDWFAGALDHQKLMTELNHEARLNIPGECFPEAAAMRKLAADHGYFETGLDTGHVSPGWRYMYGKGLAGLLAEARLAREGFGPSLTREQADFYDALEIVYDAIMTLARRFSALAASLAATAPAAARVRLLTIASALENVPANPPADLHEALQFAFLIHQMIEMEGEMVRSMAGFDRCYFPYYDADLRAGRLTREHAQELIKFFFTKFFAHTKGAGNGKNFYFGGQNADGSNAENELTYAALEAYHDMNITDPKMSVRFYRGSTDRLYRQIAGSIRAGRTAFVLINDEVVIPAILSQGKTLEEARDFLLIGCYEPAIEGREIACNMSTAISLAKCVELVLNRGADLQTGERLGPDTGDPLGFTTYDEFEAAYFTQLAATVDGAVKTVREYERCWPLINPSPVLAGTFVDCIERGKDIGQSGPKFNNTGCMATGLASAVDSLSAVKTAVFEEGVCTMGELINALRDNFDGYDKLRLYLMNRIPRWGNANPAADDIAVRIADRYTAHVDTMKNGRGGKMVASMFAIGHRYSLGKHTAALPDGRKKNEPLSLNNAANQGMDKEGVTALLRSTTCLDYTRIPNGSVTDLYLHPSAIQGEDGLEAFISLIKTYFDLGGSGIQFNIFDRDTLIDAQKHPDKYQTLQIRVCGWNVYFITLSPEEQEYYINANIHAM